MLVFLVLTAGRSHRIKRTVSLIYSSASSPSSSSSSTDSSLSQSSSSAGSSISSPSIASCLASLKIETPSSSSATASSTSCLSSAAPWQPQPRQWLHPRHPCPLADLSVRQTCPIFVTTMLSSYSLFDGRPRGRCRVLLALLHLLALHLVLILLFLPNYRFLLGTLKLLLQFRYSIQHPAWTSQPPWQPQP